MAYRVICSECGTAFSTEDRDVAKAGKCDAHD